VNFEFHLLPNEKIVKELTHKWENYWFEEIGDGVIYYIFLLKKGRETIGGAYGYYGKRYAKLLILYIDENYRNKGYGGELINKFERFAKSKGCEFVYLNTYTDKALRFYIRHKYKEKFRFNHYNGAGKHKYYLEKEL
jgi:GNAT superfamily N-acetyltransferase